MTITHYDLFAGIGGFSLALEEVFQDATIKHIFCEWEQFPTSVLRQHWPDGEFYGDIANLVSATDPKRQRPERRQAEKRQGHAELGNRDGGNEAPKEFTIVTGGFPCQPFSHAGRRKGTADDRYQWPNMFAVIRHTKPQWVIAENVRGLVTWNDGMVLETVCADLESEGYEVQPFIIPAVAVGAPHRRDRVWIIGRNTEYSKHAGLDGAKDTESTHTGNDSNTAGQDEPQQPAGPDSVRQGHAEPGDTGGYASNAVSDTEGEGQWTKSALSREGNVNGSASNPSVDTDGLREDSKRGTERQNRQYPDWSRNWQEVAFSTCDDQLDDGLRGRLVQLPDGTTLTYPKWRQNALKAFGNGIVPQVAMEIMKGIKDAHYEVQG